MTAFAAGVLFPADNGLHGTELWKSDGSEAGTALVSDINSGPLGSYPCFFTDSGKFVWFVADDGVHGAELWRSDGTSLGTFMVEDLNPGSDGGMQNDCTADSSAPVASKDTLFFPAGSQGLDGLWTSDGTAEGTRRVVSNLYPQFLVPAPGGGAISRPGHSSGSATARRPERAL